MCIRDRDLAEALTNTPALLRSVLSHDSEEDEPLPSKRSKYYNPQAKLPGTDKQYDGYEHFPIFDVIKASRLCCLEGCSSRTKILSKKCKVYLCKARNKDCFKLFHVKS